MNMSRMGLIGGVAATVLLIAAPPAGAHATFVERTAPANSEEILELSVPVEAEGVNNATVSVEIPADFQALYCYAEPGWSCAAEPKTPDAAARFVWTRTSAPPEDTDFVSFGAQTPKKAGEYAFPVDQTYSDGTVVSWSGPKDSANPAPVVTVKG